MPLPINILRGAAGALFCLCLLPGCRKGAAPSSQGWGIDACLTAHVDSAARTAYLPELRSAGISIVRERGPNPAMAELHAAGFKIVSFLGLGPLPDSQTGDVLPGDLQAVFDAAKAMQCLHGRYVDAWEMVNEPDVGYCRDLPDRLVAFQKAVYLGIKAGAEHQRAEVRRQKSEDRSQRSEVRIQTPNENEQLSEGETAKAKNRRIEDGTPLVLMGALALPPGPWLERAARNGLFDYTDAYNFHFYGHAGDLAGVIQAHEAFAMKWFDLRNRAIVERGAGQAGEEPDPWVFASAPSSIFHIRSSSIPLWITECGIDAMVPGDFLNPARRQLQADFTAATAREAQEAEHVAVFMPFILVGKGIPHALTLSPGQPLPAWNAYAGYCRRQAFPARALAMPPRNPNPVVVQWMPDNRTTIPHKVSGAYRFRRDQPVEGVLRIYNFGIKPVQGIFEGGALSHVRLDCPDLHHIAQKTGGYAGPSRADLSIDGGKSGMGIPSMSDGSAQTHGQDARATADIQTSPKATEDSGRPAFQSSELTIPAMGRLDLPVTFSPATRGYFRDFFEASFLDDRGRRSPVFFGLEAIPAEDGFVTVPITLRPPDHGRIDHPELDGAAVTSQSGAWTGINGLVVETQGLGHERTPWDTASKANHGTGPTVLKVSSAKSHNDPLSPTIALAKIDGLPLRGFLRLQLDRPMDSDFKMRVDLVDRQGQRFTVWENLGASYFGPRDDVWLNLEDFHIYFWGRCSKRPVFCPADVDEIRLRPYFARANDVRRIRLSLVQTQDDQTLHESGFMR